MAFYIYIVLLSYMELVSLGVISDSSTSATIVSVPPSCTPCQCLEEDGKMAADCSGKNLRAVPSNLFPNIVSLNLEGNNLANIEDSGKGICDMYRHLKSISLAHSSLTSLTPVIKGCAETLEELDLSGNEPIIDLEQAFPHLKSLTALKGLTVTDDVKKEFFHSLKKLRQLELSYHGFSFPANLFSEFPDLRSLRLELVKAWEFNVPLGIRVLDKLQLRGPRVRMMSPIVFSDLINLTTLDLDLPQLNSLKWQQDLKIASSLKHLSVTGVWVVNADTMRGMKFLQTLQLKGIFVLVDSSLFDQHTFLEVLEITESRMKALPSSWFSGLTSLYDLNLTNNQISELKSDSLLGLSNLRNLVLSGNRITEIPRDFLRPVAANLENLSIDRNMLVKFEDDDLPHMINLMALDLSGNRLSELHLNIFKNTPSLVHLQLQGNQIHDLSGRLDISLQRVNVSHNSLQKVPSGLMVDSIMDLDISANPIHRQTFPVKELINLENLKELAINGLEVQCECEMQRLLTLKAVHGGECISEEPDTNRKSVGDIIYDSTICETPETDTGPILDHGYNIIERALDEEESFDTKNYNDMSREPDTPDILQENGEDNLKYETLKNQKVDDGGSVGFEPNNIGTGTQNMVNASLKIDGKEKEGAENKTIEIEGTENMDDIQYVSLGIEESDSEANVKNNASTEVENADGSINFDDFAQMLKNVFDIGNAETQNISEVQHNTLEEGDYLVRENKDDGGDDDEDADVNGKDVQEIKISTHSNSLQTSPMHETGNADSGHDDTTISTQGKTTPRVLSTGIPSMTETTLPSHKIDSSDNSADHGNETAATTPRMSSTGIPSTKATTLPGPKIDSSLDSADLGNETSGSSRVGSVNGTAPADDNVDLISRTISGGSMGSFNETAFNDNRADSENETALKEGTNSVKGTSSSKEDTESESDEGGVGGVPIIIFLLVALVVAGLIGFSITVIRRMRRLGSHDLDHSRRNLAHHGEEEQVKITMTELGKSRPGQDVLVM